MGLGVMCSVIRGWKGREEALGGKKSNTKSIEVMLSLVSSHLSMNLEGKDTHTNMLSLIQVSDMQTTHFSVYISFYVVSL